MVREWRVNGGLMVGGLLMTVNNQMSTLSLHFYRYGHHSYLAIHLARLTLAIQYILFRIKRLD